MYYAVAVGRNPGIYNTWGDCKIEIDKFPGAKYKKFKTKKQALEYITTFKVIESPEKTIKQTYFKPNLETCFSDKNITTVFTDGCCINNGKMDSYKLGGYGIYFGYNDPRNLAEPYLDTPTNNKAELYAIIKTMEIVIPKLKTEKSHRLLIFTDSAYSMKAFTEWAEKWKKRGWKKSDGKPIKNLELIKYGFDLFQSYRSQITICKVKAHTGGSDLMSKANDMADRLANLGAEKMKKNY